jgi:hypothetical protein
MQKILKYWLVIFLLFFLLFSCKKDKIGPQWDVDVLAPILKTSLTLNQLITDSLLSTNQDTSVSLVFNNNLFNINTDTIFEIPDTTITDTYSPNFSINATPGFQFYANNDETTISASNGAQLKYAIIESGSIKLEIISTIQEKVVVQYDIPSASIGGQILSITETIPAANGSQNASFTKIYDISGYELKLTGTSGIDFNTIITNASAFIDPNGQTTTISPADNIIFKITLMDIVPYYARGYFGSNTINIGPSSTNFNFLNHIISGTIDLEQVSLNLDFENGIGVDLQTVVNNLSTENTNQSTAVSLNHSIIGSTINLNRATETGSIPEVNYATYPTIAFNTNNSNVDQLLEILPNKLSYDMTLTVNPLGNTSNNNDFIYKKHVIKANLDATIPLSFVANQLTLVDTFDIKVEEDENGNRVNYGTLNFYVDNGFPLNANLSFKLLNENQVEIKTFNGIENIPSAPLNASLKAVGKASKQLQLTLSEQDMEAFYNSKSIVLQVSFSTPQQPQFIKIYDYYSIDLKMVGDFNFRVSAK